MLVLESLELLGLIGLPLATYYGVTRERRWRTLLSWLMAGIAVLLYVTGDVHGWRLAWYAVEFFGILAFLQIAHSPAWAQHFESKQWKRAESFDGDPHKLLPLLKNSLSHPRFRWLSLQLDVNGDLLIGSRTGSEVGRFRIRSTEECRHCMLESMIESFVSGEPVEVLDTYRTETSRRRACIVFIDFLQNHIVMHVQYADRAPHRRTVECGIHPG